MNISPTILRAYDIRGIMGETISPEIYHAFGAAFGTVCKKRLNKDAPEIVVGRDGRLSSPVLCEALIEGLLCSGVKVTHIGVGPTPMCYFAGHEYGFDAAMMVTGSHNPPTHNGIKMMFQGKPFYGDDIQELGRMAEIHCHSGEESCHPRAGGDLLETSAQDSRLHGNDKLIEKDVLETYVTKLAEAFRAGATKKLTVAWDPGNGAAGETTEQLIKQLPGTHHLINEAIDGSFPAHHPDPTVEENLEQLKTLVTEKGCDVGIAFDGDGDRIGAVDSKGRAVWGDQLLTLYARDILKDTPNQTIIADVKASQHLFDSVKQNGGKPLMWKTGHSLIKAKMKETNAPLAGEMSGHIFFADRYYGFDDAPYAAVRLLDILARQEASLADELDAMPKSFSTPEIRLETTEEIKFSLVENLKTELAKRDDLEVDDTDGVRVNTPHGWWLVRASNTQAAIIVRVETSSEETLKTLCAEVSELLEKLGLGADLGV